MTDPATATFESARYQWEDGARRLRRLRDDADRRAAAEIDRVQAAVAREIRRRVGADYTQGDLAACYGSAIDWAQAIAMRVAPDQPDLWDTAIAVDAPFHEVWRQARDHSGRRRTGRRAPDLPPLD
jgi:hypothetical protein